MATSYSKKLTLHMSDGTTKVFDDATAANTFLKRLDNDARYVKIMSSAGHFEYYDSKDCGFCLVAEVAISSKEVANTPCEEGLPAHCPAES